MATTVRQMMNRVLVNMGEDEIPSSQTDITDTYQLLILSFINTIKEEMEDGGNWRVLQQVIPLALPTGVGTLAIAGTNDRSRLLRIQDSETFRTYPMCFNTTVPTAVGQMQEMDLQTLFWRRELDNNNPQSVTNWFALSQDTDGLNFEAYSIANVDQTFNIHLVVPQVRFVGDSSDLDTDILVPATPLELGATWYAYEERGEELGPSSLFSQERYLQSVQSAIARDQGEQGGPDLVSV